MNTIPEKDTLSHIADLFKGFADSTRLHILCLLLNAEELRVSEISERTDVSQSAVSHQLQYLKQKHLVKFRREGKNMYYSLADDHVRTILQMGLEHVMCEE